MFPVNLITISDALSAVTIMLGVAVGIRMIRVRWWDKIN